MSSASAETKAIVEVVAAVIMRPDGKFLLTRRPGGKLYSGYWEFPGGKVETGETLIQSMERELWEELGIQVIHAQRWITRVFMYPHATVRLNFFRILAWNGKLEPREKQGLFWQSPEHVNVSPILPANTPILRALRLPPIYAITHASEIGIENSLIQIQTAFQQGLRLLQIREKTMERTSLLNFSTQVIALAKTFQAKVLINSDIELAHEVGADGVHLPASQLMSISERPTTTESFLCGASCHNAEELYAAEKLALDFVVLGPVQPTLTHPNGSTLGWNRFARLIQNASVPVYALGGLRRNNLTMAQELGAHGIALMRGIAADE
ncbi:8-oxo-dGTP diphosphatase [Nitrosomonas sp. PY1]|uniref:Nudix family hydrolase n=1 Tax=Nitrosomonas sp. PY1 TaxID=1803906 RepID=UPI001FC8D0EC|nr:Nudix family hydrolase [Nitrosomonas sp. PY1]GKS70203.1 8-oxo-dGTP diphosphatase [Nitrosomonas sp. PY1]